MTDLLTGNPLKRILKFLVPLLIGNLFQQIYSLADSIIVGQLIGQSAFGAVGSTGSLNFLVLGFVMGVTGGFSIPIAQAFGAKNGAGMRKYIASCAVLCIIIVGILSVLTYFFTDDLLRLLNTPEELFQDAYHYIHVIFVGMGASVLYNMLSSLLRSVGDSKTPLYFLIVACVINIGLDFLFIAVFKMGVEGAAYATLISQLVSGLLCMITIKKRFKMLIPSRNDYKHIGAYHKRMLRYGIPMGLQFSITAVGCVIVQTAVNGLGAIAVTALSIGYRVSALLTSPIESLGIAMATFAGQNLGANRLERVKKGVNQVMIVTCIYCFSAFLLCFFFSTFLTEMFVGKTDATILAMTRQMLLSISFFYPCLAVILVYRNVVQGLGFSNEAMLAGILELGGRLLIGLVFIKHFGYAAACFSNPAAWFPADVLLLFLYYGKMRELQKPENVQKRAEKLEKQRKSLPV